MPSRLPPADDGKTDDHGCVPRDHRCTKDPVTPLAATNLCTLGDNELVAHLATGNHDALTALFARHSTLVFGIARRILRDNGEAEETVQQVFLDIYRAVDQFDSGKGAFKSWLLQFAYHRSINRREYLQARRFYDWKQISEMLPAELAEGAARQFQLSPQEIERLVEELLKSLAPRQRRIIEWTVFEGLTAEEIAKRSGESASAVRHTYYRGLIKLRSTLLQGGHVLEKAAADGVPEKGVYVAYPRTL